MLFHSSIRNELSRYFWATLVVLTTIVLTVWLIRTFGDASFGRISLEDVSLVLGYTMLSNLHSLLTLSLYVATVSTLSRMYADSEMVIWQASGQSTFKLLRPTLLFALPWLLAIIVLTLFAWPWSNQQIFEVRERFEQRGDLERIQPGLFQESADGKRVFFIDKSSASQGQGNQIFIVANENNTQTIVSSQTGLVENRMGNRYLVLSNGQRIEINAEKNEFRVVEFDTYSSLVDIKPMQTSLQDAQAKQPQELIANLTPASKGELTWRIGMIVAAVNLLLLAIGIPFINPRSGRSGSLMLTLVSFFTYYNFVNMSRNWVVVGKLGMTDMLLALHLPVFVLACLILLWRAQQGMMFKRNRRMPGLQGQPT
jgi:lipopolysaccharide export system permease protein